MLVKRLSNFLLKHKILDNHQLGFLPFHDSHTAIKMLYYNILQAKQDKKYILEISLDIQAAYESVYIDGLIQKCTCLGIIGPICNGSIILLSAIRLWLPGAILTLLPILLQRASHKVQF